MKKRCLTLIALFLLVLSILMVGCTRTPGPDADLGPEKIYIGTEGLRMWFVNNMPPPRIYDAGSLDILLELENKGTSDLSGNKCRIYLSGFDNNIIRGIDKDKMCGTSLEGKSILNPEGGFNTQQFSTSRIELPDYLDKLPQRLVVTACYEYQTTASPIVCIDPHLYEIGPIERACLVRDVGMGGGQGAPVAVSSVGVQMAGKDRVTFDIRVSNVGAGTALDVGANVFTECPFRIDPKDYNIVRYDVDMAGGQLIDCSPRIDGSQRVRLTNNQGRIFCTFRISGDTAYTTPLRIILDYNYMDSVSQNIDIIKTPQ